MTWTLFIVWIIATGPQPVVGHYLALPGFPTAPDCAVAGKAFLEWYKNVDRLGMWAWNVSFECEIPHP